MIISANFKTNKTRRETVSYLEELGKVDFEDVKVAVFPPQTALIENELVGAQNAYPTKNGAFTGEIGLEQLEEFNIERILIGHSERRHILNESQEFIAEKFQFFKEQGFEIFYCIGEPLEVREQGIEAVADYLKKQFEGIDLEYEKLIIAYEPVWAIGTGVSATIDQIRETHSEIRKWTSKPILYGGSVKLNNIKEILEVENVDGALVGSASLDLETFKGMIETAKEIEK